MRRDDDEDVTGPLRERHIRSFFLRHSLFSLESYFLPSLTRPALGRVSEVKMDFAIFDVTTLNNEFRSQVNNVTRQNFIVYNCLMGGPGGLIGARAPS